MGHHRTGERAADEAHGGGTLAGLVGVEFDVVVLGDAAALSFEPTNALPDLVEVFLGTRFGQPFGELGQCVLEAFGEALDDAALLGGAFLGKAVKAGAGLILSTPRMLESVNSGTQRGAGGHVGLIGATLPT